MLLDTASLYYRSFYALPSSMRAPDGFPNNAVRGLLQTIQRLRARFEPSVLIAAWDNDWRPQWRVEQLSSYKTHRVADEATLAEDEPDELGPQIGAIAAILTAWGVPVVGVDEFEADDIIGTLAHALSDMNRETLVITGDRDLVQLVGNTVQVVLTVSGGLDGWPVLDAPAVVDRFGVMPQQYLDLAVLRGDPSDGLPGVRGIGEKTAKALIATYGGLGELQVAAESDSFDKPLTPRLAGAIRDSADYLQAAAHVSRVRPDVPIRNVSGLLMTPIPSEPVDAVAWNDLVDDWGVRAQAVAAMELPKEQS